ncbi:hypothetical protein NPIL_353621 [Nephila pilipes]|uniref:Uncharacterized protein n=1 Tax=Nephila pilipes TaxID=299642 RepID=A0A8X6UKB0_NEPPI|nr:hypothetical protein NPIL_353621 [Nephila pilipes]
MQGSSQLRHSGRSSLASYPSCQRMQPQTLHVGYMQSSQMDPSYFNIKQSLLLVASLTCLPPTSCHAALPICCFPGIPTYYLMNALDLQPLKVSFHVSFYGTICTRSMRREKSNGKRKD